LFDASPLSGYRKDMIREVIVYPHSTLRKIAKPVKEIDDEIRTLLIDMPETMYADDGVGLAAPQINVSFRIIVIDTSPGDEKSPGLIKMINPEITSRDGTINWEEGCLSVPDLRVNIERNNEIIVDYLDENGDEQSLTCSGLTAVAIQHEIDHLNGRLIIDYAGRIKRDLYERKLKKIRQENQKT